MRNASGLAFGITVMGNQPRPEIGQRRPAARLATAPRNHHRLLEHAVHLINQQPCAPIGHAMLASGGGDRAGSGQGFEQGNLARPEPLSVGEIKPYGHARCGHNLSCDPDTAPNMRHLCAVFKGFLNAEALSRQKAMAQHEKRVTQLAKDDGVMTLEQLRIFVAVAERLHVTQAAEAMHMSQSAASTALAALEARHNVRLFDRIGRHLELTTAGAEFLVDAREVLAKVAQAEALLDDLAGLRRGRLTIYASQTIASYWLPRHLVRYYARAPKIDLDLRVANTAEVAAAVQSGVAELGFIEGRINAPDLISRNVARDQLMLVVAPGHALAQKPPEGLQDLKGIAFVMREAGSGTRSGFIEALQACGMKLADIIIALELPNNEAVRAAAEAGAGAAVLSASVVASSLEAGLLISVPLALPVRDYAVLQHNQRRPSAAARALLALLPEQAAD